MKYIAFFFLGFALAVALHMILNAPQIRRRRKRRKEELEAHPEKKTSATKVVLFSIMLSYYVAFMVAIWVVVCKDVYQLGTLLTFTGGVTAAAVAFYCWKAKAENLLKIKAAHPELSGALSEFANMN